ncbi:MAG: 3-keto-5-aminohexanoate cleavage protein, partial [Verrucomicrobiaceae bacterium]
MSRSSILHGSVLHLAQDRALALLVSPGEAGANCIFVAFDADGRMPIRSMAMQKLIIEVRMNEYATRSGNPNVPWTPQEITEDALACREAGASSVHFHCRTAEGRPDHSFESYREVVSGLRAKSDLLLHPTLGADENDGSPAKRLSYVTRLAEQGLAVDLAPMDMGSTNVDFFDSDTGEFTTVDKVYINTTATLIEFAKTFREMGMKPCLATWNVGMLQLAQAFVRKGLVDAPPFLALSLGGDQTLPLHP